MPYEPHSDEERIPIHPLWAKATPLLQSYYDNEWGVPVLTEHGIFERITLEAFQSGLSWRTILERREGFRRAFAQFDPEIVATFTENTVEKLLIDTSIIRNRRKIEATIHNAKKLLEFREQGSIVKFIWSFVPAETLKLAAEENPPATREESHRLARALKAFGFRFVGPTTAYALMCAVGIDNPHPVESARYAEIEAMRQDVIRQLSKTGRTS